MGRGGERGWLIMILVVIPSGVSKISLFPSIFSPFDFSGSDT